MYLKNFSVVVGNSKYDRYYFNIGFDVFFFDWYDSVLLRFRVFRVCSLYYDFCVVGGGYFMGIFLEYWSI